MESEKEKSAEIEVTPEMIEAGYGILAKSAITDDLLEADREWVAEIYRAMRREQLRPMVKGHLRHR